MTNNNPTIGRRELIRRGGKAWVAASLAGGCGRSLAGREETELIFWVAPTGTEEQGFQRLCRRYEQEHPGIRIRSIGASTEEKLIRAIVAGTPPDLAYLYGTTFLGPLAAHDALLPLDTFFARSALREEMFLPGAITQCRYRGRLWAMPVTRDSRALYWNRQRFREAGLPPDRPPKTTQEAMEYAQRLTQRTSGGSLVKLGMLPSDDPAIVFALFGGGVTDPQTGAITANRPENITALRWHIALTDVQGGIQAVSAFTAGFGRQDSAQNPLATGKIAFRIDGEWAAMHLDKYAPGTDYVLGELPYPAERPDLRNLAWQDGDIMVIPTGARHQEQTWAFMRWLHLPRQQEEYAAHMNNLPSLLSLRDAPTFSQGSRSRRALGYVLNQIASNTANFRFFPALPITQLYRNVLRNAFDQALYHEKSPEAALHDVQTRMEQEMKRFLS